MRRSSSDKIPSRALDLHMSVSSPSPPLGSAVLNESVGKSSGWLRNDPWQARKAAAARIIDSNGQKTTAEQTAK